jgi:hypothetical protein
MKASAVWLLGVVLVPVMALAQAPAADVNTITAVQVNGGTVSISGTKKPNFTTFTMTDPPRLVIDISEAVFSGVPEEVQVGNGTVTGIRTASYGSDASAIARVLIGYEREVETDIQANGNQLIVKVAGGGGQAVAQAPAETPAAQPSGAAEPATKPAGDGTAAQAAAAAETERQAQEKATAQAAAAAAADRQAQEKAAAEATARAQADADAEKKRQEEARAAAQRQEEETRASAQAAADEKKRQEEAARASAQAAADEKKRQEEEARASAKTAEEERRAAAQAAADEKKRQQEEARSAAKSTDEERRAAAQAAADEKKRQAQAAAEERQAAAQAAADERRAEQEAAAEERRQRQEQARASRESTKQEKLAMAEPRERTRREVSSGSDASAEVSSRRKTMTLVGFQQQSGASRVFIRTNEPVRYTASEDGRSVVVELENTRIDLSNNTRPLDTSFFSSPVTRVEADSSGRAVRVTINLREQVPFQARQEGNVISLDFQRTGR